MRVLELFPGNYPWSFSTLLAVGAGAQLGDVGLIMPRLEQAGGDTAVWSDAWTWLAHCLEERAQAALDQDEPAGASEDLFLASLYHLMAERFMLPDTAEREAMYGRALDAFGHAMQLSERTISPLRIPFEGGEMTGHFIASPSGAGPLPTVVFVCGLDTTKELSFLRVRHRLADRGFHCLVVDTPGVGEALRRQRLYTRYDYERPVSAIIDWLVGQDKVDARRIALVGSSLGGYYVSRAAAFEPRVAACVSWGAIYDYHRVWADRLARGGAVGVPMFQLRWITGAPGDEEALARIEHFRMPEFGAQIRCPYLLMHGADDRQVSLADAQAAFAAVGSSDKTFKVFHGEDGGSQHCQMDNPLPALHYLAAWLRRTLR